MKNTVYISARSVTWTFAKAALKAEYANTLTHPSFVAFKVPAEIGMPQIMEALKDLRLNKDVSLMIHNATDSSPYVIYTPVESDEAKDLLEKISNSAKKDVTSEFIAVPTGYEPAKPECVECGVYTPKKASVLEYTKEDMKEVQDELEYATDKIACLEDEIQEFKNDLKDSKKDNEVLLDKIKKLEKEIEDLEEDKEDLHKTIESLEDELSDTKAQMTDLEFDIEQRDSMLDDYEDKIKELEDKLSKLTPDPDNRILIHDGVAYRY